MQKKNIKSKNQKIKIAPKRFSFSISFPGLCVSVIIAIIVISWSFIFGVIIGRGYNPEQHFSLFTELLPETTPPLEEVTKHTLKPEDLNFMVELKQESKINNDEPNQAEQKNTNKTIEAEKQTKTESKTEVLVGKNRKKHEKIEKETKIAEKEKQQEQTVKTKNTMIYDFIFQVASFKKAEQAESLRLKLEEKGIRTQLVITKNVKNIPSWYHVRALLRGLETDADHIKSIFTLLKLSDIKCIEKEPTGKHR